MAARAWVVGACAGLGLALTAARRAPADEPAPPEARAVVGGRLTTDAALTTRIKDMLAVDPVFAGVKPVVTADGVVTLTGSVPDDDVRARAIDIAESVTGVRRVDDHLRLKRARR